MLRMIILSGLMLLSSAGRARAWTASLLEQSLVPPSSVPIGPPALDLGLPGAGADEGGSKVLPGLVIAGGVVICVIGVGAAVVWGTMLAESAPNGFITGALGGVIIVGVGVLVLITGVNMWPPEAVAPTPVADAMRSMVHPRDPLVSRTAGLAIAF